MKEAVKELKQRDDRTKKKKTDTSIWKQQHYQQQQDYFKSRLAPIC
jgi:hypothetical protein